ncbi:(2Fe-2S)-binding protein [Photobacterium angustum]|uniref:NADH-quinone oxidoreductase n=1 Tax=Photobacterium angustum TaxID=661 RepID=A0ABX5H7G5_PHOAN|nr:NADH-quinone oxidoreductase subunit NuoG [Photobacterium angustum]KJG39007.1 (2Fe-2S)-binding protein [Photobacterium angustum]PSX11610.1 NADH dehydrogenase (quinone) subunit G [Photobacterium angustum]
MGTIYIDDKAVEFEPGQNVLDAARKAGIDTPYFCYHPALGAAGSCRICAMETVPQKEGEKPRTVMTCSIPAQDGQQFRFKSPKAKQIQKAVVEFYMTNHPNDCPVCDEGGDCHLQDTTISVGHAYRRYDGQKRTMPDQFLGPLVYQTMNRCVTCYRCVRFYQDYALGDDFGAMGSSNHVLFRRTEDGAFDSPFSGNLVSVCPTGVFTDKVYRRKYSRTWMLEKAPSICSGCSVGCNIEVGGREGTLRRVQPNNEESKVNPYFICDRGRYGSHGTESHSRPKYVSEQGKVVKTSPLDALKIALVRAEGHVGILGSVEEDLTTNLALKAIAKEMNAPFSPFISPQQEALTKTAVAANNNAPSISDIEQSDAVFVLGELTEHAPMLDLAVRQVIKAKKDVYVLHATPSHLVTALNKLQRGHVKALAPSQWQDCLTQINTAVHDGAVEDLWIKDVANALKQAEKPVIIGVAELLNTADISLLNTITESLAPTAKMAIALPSAGSVNAALTAQENSCAELMAQIESDKIKTLVVVGSDPLNTNHPHWHALHDKLDQLIVIDKVLTKTAHLSDTLLPLAAWPERDGMTINYEGRLQRFSKAFARKTATIDAHDMIETLMKSPETIEQWLTELAPTLPQAGDDGIIIEKDKLKCTELPLEQKTNPPAIQSTQPQVALSKWFGEGYVADHAPEIRSLKPGSSASINPKLAASLNLSNGDQLMIICGDQKLVRPAVISSQVADLTVALNQADMRLLQADIASPLCLERTSELFIDADKKEEIKNIIGSASVIMMGEA